MVSPRWRRRTDQNGATIGTDGRRSEGDVENRTLPGGECQWTGESANGVASSAYAYARNANACAPRICNTHRLGETAPEEHIAEAQSGWGHRDLLGVCLEWKENHKKRNKEERSPGPNQAEAGHSSHLCLCVVTHSGGMVVLVQSPAGPVKMPA